MLIENLKKLRDIWNTLIIVEHDEDIMREADHIIDIWPWAWVHWGQIIAEGSMQELIESWESVTGPFLHPDSNIVVERPKREVKNHLEIIWATQNNLKNIDVQIPLGNFVVVTWVSGSWKSSLVNDILANHLMNELNRAKRQVGQHKEIKWLENLDKAVVIDQSPIGKTPRSNPATYTGVFTPIREVFAQTSEAQVRWYGPGRFSFNTKQGRCPECEWDGVKKIEMHFLPPVYIECESCKWHRYNSETLQIKYKWKTISDVLEMTIEEAGEFFSSHPKIVKTMQVLNDVWLGYIKLWQSSVTLSWWEAQRIKLATELSKRSTSKTFYILDEPTTGLHFQDVQKLLHILHSLVNKWNTVLVIEHNMDVIMNADHIIDIWKEWWNRWGELLWTWTIQDIANLKESYTGEAIKKYLKNK
jgi:excinuclease ABC subunit A